MWPRLRLTRQPSCDLLSHEVGELVEQLYGLGGVGDPGRGADAAGLEVVAAGAEELVADVEGVLAANGELIAADDDAGLLGATTTATSSTTTSTTTAAAVSIARSPLCQLQWPGLADEGVPGGLGEAPTDRVQGFRRAPAVTGQAGADAATAGYPAKT